VLTNNMTTKPVSLLQTTISTQNQVITLNGKITIPHKLLSYANTLDA